MDIKIVDEAGVEKNESESLILNPSSDTQTEGIMMVEQLGKVFNLEPKEISFERGKLETLIEYAKLKTDDHSPDGLKWAVRSLGTKVGTPPLGEKLLPYLYRYARIYLESKHIEDEKNKFLRGETD